MKKYLALLLFLTACGGAPPAVVSINTFPLASAYKAFVTTPQNIQYSASATVIGIPVPCDGAASSVIAAPVAVTFEGSPASSVAEVDVVSSNNCLITPILNAVAASSETINSALYLDASGNTVGDVVTGRQYGVSSSPISLPASVSVGSSGTLGTINLWTTSAKTTPYGNLVFSYAVTANNASTANVAITMQQYDTTNKVTVTEVINFTIDANGVVVPTTLTFQNGTVNLTLTKT